VANTLAYYDTATITAVKSFIVQVPGVNELAYFRFFASDEEKGITTLIREAN
jgi:hypothetical protein